MPTPAGEVAPILGPYSQDRETSMPKEIFPSSFECDCGKRLDFFENTIRGMKRESKKGPCELLDGPDGHEHRILLEDGKFVTITCPDRPKGPKKTATPKTPTKGRAGKKVLA